MSEVFFLRDVVGNHMAELGKRDESVIVVNADLARTCRNTDFVKMFPNRSFNLGIQEQNLVSFAAGLSVEGFKPYAFTMAPFMSMRACEQVRTDVAYGKRNVKLVSVYSGLSGGISGPTHWAIEDCGIMCSIPEMTVIEPSSPVQAKKLLEESLHFSGPVYFRITTGKVPEIYSENDEFRFGGSRVVRTGDAGVILCSGITVQFALQAAERIKEKYGLDFRVVDMYSVKPIDEGAVIDAAATSLIVAVQDHNVIGGLGSMIAKIVAEKRLDTDFKVLGVPDTFGSVGHADFLYHKYGYDADGIEKATCEHLQYWRDSYDR